MYYKSKEMRIQANISRSSEKITDKKTGAYSLITRKLKINRTESRVSCVKHPQVNSADHATAAIRKLPITHRDSSPNNAHSAIYK